MRHFSSDPPWCNGSTLDFGSNGSGSNPGGGADYPRRTRRAQSGRATSDARSHPALVAAGQGGSGGRSAGLPSDPGSPSLWSARRSELLTSPPEPREVAFAGGMSCAPRVIRSDLEPAIAVRPTDLGAVTAVIVLAAGAGTRMKSSQPKVLHELAGKPMLWHALHSAAGLSPTRLVAVLGHGRDEVGEFLAGVGRPARGHHRRPGRAVGHRTCLRLRVGRHRRPHRHGAGHLRRRAAAADLHPARAGRRARRQRQCRDHPDRESRRPDRLRPDHPRAMPAMWSASSSRRTPTPSNAPSARSTPGSTPSTAPCSPTHSAGCPTPTPPASGT